MAKIWITGSNGFVGTNLTAELRKRGHSVWGSDIKHSADKSYIRCDVNYTEQIRNVFGKFKPDYVYHLAAEYGRWNCEDYDENAIITNILGTRNMLKMQNLYGFKMIFFSSAEVYGDYDDIMTEDVMDKVPIKQINEYAQDKWHGELMCLSFADMHGNEIVRVRPGCMYGIHEYYHPYRGVIPKFIYHALMDEPYTVYENHTRIHDYIEDSCKTYANIVDNFKAGEVYNVGGNPENNHTIRELSDLILRLTGKSDNNVRYEAQEPYTTRHKTLDSGKAIRDLGHNPTTTLAEGLKKTIAWMESVYGRRESCNRHIENIMG